MIAENAVFGRVDYISNSMYGKSSMYLYHIAPQRLIGTNIVPLEDLKWESRTLYNQAKAKYLGREGLIDVEIPPLKCTWKEVVFLTAIHPD